MSNFEDTREFIDNMTDKVKPIISCRKGCAHCCSYEVICSDEEADILTNMIINGDIKIDMDKLIQHKDFGQEKLSEKDARCIFLTKDNECGVYEQRPLMCRRYIVSSNPDFCKRGNKGTVAFLMSRDIEAKIAKLQNGYMPKKIYKRLKDAKYI